MQLDQRARRRFFSSYLTWCGLVGSLLLILVAVFGPYLAPHPIRLRDVVTSNEPPKLAPSALHPFGTDWHGLDVFSRVLWGTRYTIGLGLSATAVSMALGAAVGVSAGYFGGLYDAFWMRFVDVVLAFPSLLLAILIGASLTPGLLSVFLALTAVSWAGVARLVRSLALTLKDREYILAAEAIGCSHGRILWRHLLPNMAPTLLVIATSRIGITILTEASLSFLGLGPPPNSPSWGVMVFYGMDHLTDAPWCSIFPATAIAVSVLVFNLVGDGLRDAMDLRLES